MNASQTVAPLPAIDAHGHCRNYLDDNRLLAEFSSATAAEVAARARGCGVVWTPVSPLDELSPRGRGQRVADANERACVEVAATPGLLQYVIVNPL